VIRLNANPNRRNLVVLKRPAGPAKGSPIQSAEFRTLDFASRPRRRLQALGARDSGFALYFIVLRQLPRRRGRIL
jgi:hypothetical protein